MTPEEFISKLEKLHQAMQQLPDDVAVLALDLFDQNFEKQGFFGNKWKESKRIKQYRIKKKKQGSTLVLNGHLRRSLRYVISGMTISFESNVPYAEIHNSGGTINHPGGTAYIMKGNKAIFISNKKADKNDKRTKAHSITMPQRQFIGEHPELLKEIKELIDQIIIETLS